MPGPPTFSWRAEDRALASEARNRPPGFEGRVRVRVRVRVRKRVSTNRIMSITSDTGKGGREGMGGQATAWGHKDIGA